MAKNSIETCINLLESDENQGLTTENIQVRLAKYGANVLAQPKQT
ncbi:MAG: cation-transporting P-type ATPase, partial [Culicoidibacterales bacterium]